MQPALAIRFWGVRGSVPAPGARTARHGGNTPCVEVRAADGTCVVLDAGTGIRALGDRLVADARAAGRRVDVTVCLTHAHWDHIHGLPFFAPLYEPGARVTLLVDGANRAAMERALRDQMRAPVFPVAWDSLAAEVRVEGLPDGGVSSPCGRLVVRAVSARHPGGACGFAVAHREGGGPATLVYLPDNEIAERGGDAAWRRRLLAAVADAGLLIHDATYLPGELRVREGWGHSAWDEAVRLAAEGAVRRLVLFHHDADRSDAAVDALLAEARALAGPDGPRVLAASEGLVLHG